MMTGGDQIGQLELRNQWTMHKGKDAQASLSYIFQVRCLI